MAKTYLALDSMELAVIALIQHRNLKKAAAAAGVHPVTLWRWLKLPHFRAQLHQAHAQVYSAAFAYLQRSAIMAARTLVKLLDDPNTPASSRMRAAEYILESLRTPIAIDEIELDDTIQGLAVDSHSPQGTADFEAPQPESQPSSTPFERSW